MTHDYKAAIEYIDRKFRETTFIYDGHPLLTVYHALRIADKLMQEPSFDMFTEGAYHLQHSFNKEDDELPQQIFKAMRDQLLREIEQEGDQ